MKRDMDLVRKIMMIMNEHEHGNAPRRIEIEGYSAEQIAYHCFIMDEAGLIQAADCSSMSSTSPEAIPIRLTWDGHEFIENASNENIWNQTKGAVAKVGDVSFSVWASVLSKVVLDNLGLSN